jgi:molybdopterin-guanine dinucleotide biosynthesis protein A
LNASTCYSLGILAGGDGERWGGRDKGLIVNQGEPLVARLCLPRPQLRERLICCRSNPHFYQHFADRVLCDVHPGQGPCAGIAALLSATETESLIVLPVDLIGAPHQVMDTLEQEWRDTDAALILRDENGRHSPCIRLRRDTMARCSAYIDEGGARLLELYNRLQARSVVVPSEWLLDADAPEALKLL